MAVPSWPVRRRRRLSRSDKASGDTGVGLPVGVFFSVKESIGLENFYKALITVLKNAHCANLVLSLIKLEMRMRC